MMIHRIGLLLAMLLFAGCAEQGIQIQANFDNAQQFKPGAELYFDGQVVGSVDSVESSAEGSLVYFNIKPEMAQSLSSKSAIVVNRLKECTPLEIYNRGSNTEHPLVSGQTVKGLDSMVQLGAWMVGDAIKLGETSLSDYVQSFQDYLSGEQFQQDKDAVKQQLDSARSQAQTVVQQLEEDLQAGAEQLAATEQAAAEVLESLGEELAPIVEGLAGDGAKLAQELQQFADSLQQQNEDERLAGEAFLASLLTTLERLNQAFEDGAQAPLEQQESQPAEQ